MNSHALKTKSAPWYREPWPWVLIALPLCAVIAGVATLVIAIKHEDGLVAEDYYKQGLEINRVLARESRAAALGLSARVMLSNGRIRVGIDGSNELPGEIMVRFIHPTRAGEDRTAALRAIADGWYEGIMPAMTAGRWRVHAEDDQGRWRVTGTWNTSQPLFALSAGDGY